ncbi:ribosome assembly factor SBDS, partial [Candidatus Woesearchaeota archaeon]|nr:ribosome assembly factor SBDS [Candidatus Woesearchaeota archaeon]
MPGQAIFDRSDKISFNLAKFKKAGKEFEVVIDADKAVEFKEGKPVDIKDILQSENIYSDAKKGMLASETQLKQIFETENSLQIAEQIITEGEIQLTAEYRKKLREQKLNRIVELIRQRGIDPRTNLPHPAARIESAIKEAKVKIDELKTAEEQVQPVVAALRPVLPIRIELQEIALKISAENAVKSYSAVKRHATILKEEWLKDGSWVCVVEVPA